MILYILWRKYTSHIAFHTSSTCSMLFNDLVNDLNNYEISKLWLSTTYCYTIASQGKLFINTARNLLALPYSIQAQTLLVPVDHKKNCRPRFICWAAFPFLLNRQKWDWAYSKSRVCALISAVLISHKRVWLQRGNKALFKVMPPGVHCQR